MSRTSGPVVPLGEPNSEVEVTRHVYQQIRSDVAGSFATARRRADTPCACAATVRRLRTAPTWTVTAR
ncbi:hypothetical protein [Streptomyces sp. NPDC058572]|uniref:hypothetical protein n=1 Tax=Streptomyces sp. NPDC058572 TaxID=3346546 RepID=UPI00365F3232